MSELKIVKRLERLPGLCDPECCGRCVECPAECVTKAAALIAEQHAALERIKEIADAMGGKTPAQRCSLIVDECAAALARAQEE